ncbi:hypothetical protein GCK72_020009 [Caenorhabditis remanei]|nr:hypothetical protein GCK72_020009 [Caenorhabditis remanei]KAF1753452.1 hypothetical protein GCK72_020009 [Caenorhabditis remanei]
MAGRCSLVSASYAILLIHFFYRYLAINNSKMIRERFPLYMAGSAVVFVVYFEMWHGICYFFGSANMEVREYIREEFQETYGLDSMDFNMLGALPYEASDETTNRSWVAIVLWSCVSTLSIVMFWVLAGMTNRRLNKFRVNVSHKTSRFQVELLRALVVQTVIPIFISFAPCMLSWYGPMFGIQLARGYNYFEVSALGVFAFVDPVAIFLCLPIFRRRIFCVCYDKSTSPTTICNSRRTI